MVQSSLDDTHAKIIGVEAIIGYVDKSKVRKTQALEEVFLVDVSADEHLADNPGNKDYMQHFGWDLYHQR